ncbi:hypothetical protein DL93DRAFT_2082354 [Clavulina sp. PMI_390]|nr:hypothetical protein DL93DRAFT_2082354 [Clavulina sp. PMI_390]
MTALRILAHELQRSDTQKDAGLSIHYCEAIEVLLDYVDDTILLYPAWGKHMPFAKPSCPRLTSLRIILADIPGPVKTKLITAAEAIRRPIAGKSW